VNDSIGCYFEFFKFIFSRVVKALLPVVEIMDVAKTCRYEETRDIIVSTLELKFKITNNSGHDRWRVPSHHRVQVQSRYSRNNPQDTDPPTHHSSSPTASQYSSPTAPHSLRAPTRAPLHQLQRKSASTSPSKPRSASHELYRSPPARNVRPASPPEPVEAGGTIPEFAPETRMNPTEVEKPRRSRCPSWGYSIQHSSRPTFWVAVEAPACSPE